MAARSWVETAAKDLPAFNIDGHGGHGGHGDVDIVSSMGPQQFASLTLRIYCEHFAGKERLYYRGPEEVQDFIRVVFHSGGITLSSRLVQMAMGAVVAVAEQIDLNNLGYLDITQCLLLADGVLRWILTTVTPPTRKDGGQTGNQHLDRLKYYDMRSDTVSHECSNSSHSCRTLHPPGHFPTLVGPWLRSMNRRR